MYYLLLLRKGLYHIQYKGDDLAELKQYRKHYWQNVRYRIIQSDDVKIQRDLNKINKPIKSKTAKLSNFKARDVAGAILCDNTYQHCTMFKNKQDAITNINNFTSFVTRNDKYKGLFKTNLTHCIVSDELFFLTVISYKGESSND